MKFRIPISIRYLLTVFAIGMGFFTVFRLVFVFSNAAALKNIPITVILQSLFMGLRFDTVVSGYILIIPAGILLIAELLGVLGPRIFRLLHTLLCVLYLIAFVICATDIPFFNNFGNRLNITVLNWTHSPLFMAKMVLEEWRFLVFLFLFLVTALVFIYQMVGVRKKFTEQILVGKVTTPLILQLLLSLVFIGLIIVGIRGRVEEKTSIKVGTAYFSSYDFANQTGLNPVFTFGLSAFDALSEENKHLHLVDDKEAVRFCRTEMHADSTCNYGVLRYRPSNITPMRPNVVIVLMESMSGTYMQRFGNTKNLTPNLDSLARSGYSFDNFYSAGIHTFNGIYSTLYSMPALMARHTMFGATIPQMTGLPYAVKQQGYQTIYFTTHDDQFDNVGGFLRANNIDTIISKKDYPSAQILSTLGVPDHYLFDNSLPVLDGMANKGKPFLAVMMTASNHNPYIVPKDIPFTPQHPDERGGTVEYADWAIGHFMEGAKNKTWYANTIFVFVADHGSYDGEGYGDMPLSLNHIPCIIYSPLLHDTKAANNPGGQIDLFPTLAGLMGWAYTNNTMGTDLLNNPRPYMYFSQDDKVGVTDTANLYMWHPDGWQNMYSLKGKNEILKENMAKADSMHHYFSSMLQCSQWMLENKQTGLQKNACK